MDTRNPKVFARLKPEFLVWVDDHAKERWQGNQSAVVREALLMYRTVVNSDLEPVVRRQMREIAQKAA